jgi:DUF1680 family protein
MYITGGCGSLYDGVSNDGTSYNPNDVEKLHQAYGRKYQLPNLTAHNETCANIGNVLWNWRMLQLTGDAKYADVMELALYNSVLSGISLDGTNFLYTNPLAYSDNLPFQQRWSKDRVPYISLSNCCPPNVVRTIAEVSDYMYSLSDDGLFVNLYGGNRLHAKWKDGSAIDVTQQTAYPWNGDISFTVQQVPANFSFFLRIPQWAKGAKIFVNGVPYRAIAKEGTYAEVKQAWKKGDVIKLVLPMEAKLMESNPMVEETRNMVAVKRGPVVYCLETADLPKGTAVFNVGLSAHNKFVPQQMKMGSATVEALATGAIQLEPQSWKGGLYKELSQAPAKTVPVRLVPYFAWGNRGHGEMSVWLPVR